MMQQKGTAGCPLGLMTSGSVWKFEIIAHLLSGTKRFGELQRLMPQTSRQSLTLQLRELEQTGVLRRQVYPQVPPKVEYSLTELGRSSEPLIRQMQAWYAGYIAQNSIKDQVIEKEQAQGNLL